jgi:hypothetical protein
MTERRVIHVDVEASSLNLTSYPAEIGWAELRWSADRASCEILVRSVLVHPTTARLAAPGGWERQAEDVHGLSQERLLREGLPVAEVCDLLDSAWAGTSLWSDTGGRGIDSRWLSVLYDAAGRRPAWHLEEVSSHRLADQLGLRAMMTARQVDELRRKAPLSTHSDGEGLARGEP